jgi:hypothetical protein
MLGFFYSTLILKIRIKNLQNKKLESIREKHLVERRNKGRKPVKNSSLRRHELMPRNLNYRKNAVQEIHL